MRRALLCGLSLASLVAVSQAQQPPAPPTCEQQVLQQYRQLVAAQKLVDAVPPLSTWLEQLVAVSSEVWKKTTQYEIKRNQSELAERNVAELLEQLRRAQAVIADLRSQIEKVNGASEAPPSPSN